MYQDQQKERVAQQPEDTAVEDTEAGDTRDRKERLRLAVLSSIFAARETQQPMRAAGGIGDFD